MQKKLLLFVSVWLAMTVLCGGGLLFAGGSAARESAGQSGRVAEVADLDEVPDIEYLPRRNPGVQRASGSVYAVPATALIPEEERLPPPVYAISGIRGVEIHEDPLEMLEAVDIVVVLPEKITFSEGILEGADVSRWIQNLPDGLTARAHGVKKGANSIKIYISGTPTVTAKELIRVQIPTTAITGGNSLPFASPTEQESFDSWQKSQTGQGAKQ
jgi:hypothetical protein